MSSKSTYEDLAAHFMGGASEREPVGPGQAPTFPSSPVLVAVCGNLPSMTGIWLAQLAERLARTSGATGLVRFDDQRMRIDVFHADGRTVPEGDDALHGACRFVRRWLLALPEGFEASDITLPESALVLVTGCDEAAVAAARLRLQGLSDTLGTAGAQAPIHLVTVGASQDAGAGVGAALVEWSAGRSGQSVRWCGSIERVDRLEGIVTAQWRGRTRRDFRAVAQEILESMSTHTRRFDEPVPTQPAAPAATPASPEMDASPDATPLIGPTTPRKEPAMTTAAHRPTSVATARPETHDAAPERPVSTGSDAAASRGQRVEPTRTSLVAWFPEFVGIRIRPANAPSVELAIDMHGRLHLLSTDASTRDLRVARAWCTSNWSLLTAAVVDLRQDHAPEMVDHLVLDEARLAVPLHGSGVLMCVGIEVAGQRRRVDLNDEPSAGLGR